MVGHLPTNDPMWFAGWKGQLKQQILPRDRDVLPQRAARAASGGRVLEPCNQGDGNGHFGGTDTPTRNNGGALPVARRRLDEPSPRMIAAMCRRATAGSNDDAADRQAAVRCNTMVLRPAAGAVGTIARHAGRGKWLPIVGAWSRRGAVASRAGRPCIVRMIWWRSVARTKMIGGAARRVCRRGPGAVLFRFFTIYDSNCRGEPWPGISDN